MVNFVLDRFFSSLSPDQQSCSEDQLKKEKRFFNPQWCYSSAVVQALNKWLWLHEIICLFYSTIANYQLIIHTSWCMHMHQNSTAILLYVYLHISYIDISLCTAACFFIGQRVVSHNYKFACLLTLLFCKNDDDDIAEKATATVRGTIVIIYYDVSGTTLLDFGLRLDLDDSAWLSSLQRASCIFGISCSVSCILEISRIRVWVCCSIGVYSERTTA